MKTYRIVREDRPNGDRYYFAEKRNKFLGLFTYWEFVRTMRFGYLSEIKYPTVADVENLIALQSKESTFTVVKTIGVQ